MLQSYVVLDDIAGLLFNFHIFFFPSIVVYWQNLSPFVIRPFCMDDLLECLRRLCA